MRRPILQLQADFKAPWTVELRWYFGQIFSFLFDSTPAVESLGSEMDRGLVSFAVVGIFRGDALGFLFGFIGWCKGEGEVEEEEEVRDARDGDDDRCRLVLGLGGGSDRARPEYLFFTAPPFLLPPPPPPLPLLPLPFLTLFDVERFSEGDDDDDDDDENDDDGDKAGAIFA